MKINLFPYQLIKNFIFISLSVVFISLSQNVEALPINVTSTNGTPSADYSTLKAAIDAINSKVHTGDVIVNIFGNTIETSTITLNSDPSILSILLRPQGGQSRKISCNLSGSLFVLNGTKNLTIDGLNSNSNSLTFENTNTSSSANTILIMNSASYNIIRNCSIFGSTDLNPNNAVVTFGSGSNNHHNKISYCNIGASGSNYPWACVVSASGIHNYYTIENCNLYNFKLTNSMYRQSAIFVNDNTAANWLITNNSFYQTNTITLSADKVSMLYANNVDGFNISNNYFGGTSSECGGNAMTYMGGVNYFFAIEFVGKLNSTNWINNNFVQNISFSSSSTVNSNTHNASRFCAFALEGGNLYVNGNTIGKDNTMVIYQLLS